MAKQSPTQRALRQARELFPLVEVVEHWNPHARVRKDLFGFADLIAVDGDAVTLIQVTTESHHADRRKKIIKSDNAVSWLAGLGRKLEVWSYGRRQGGYKLRREEIRFADLYGPDDDKEEKSDAEQTH